MLTFYTCRVDTTETTGTLQSHPKVYIGFFKHPNFPNKDDHLATLSLGTPDQEYRSDDWYYWPVVDDLHPGSEIGTTSLQ